MEFGSVIREAREELASSDKSYSLRKVSKRVGIQPTYLSKIERGELPPPSEETIRKLSLDLELDVDLMLAMAGKVSVDLRAIICKRPLLFSKLIRELKTAPDHAVLSVIREVTDGDW
jgi:transcriptional regulator with XRE-family HTH domain